MPKRKKQNPPPKKTPPPTTDPKQVAEALLRYRTQPGMRSSKRFINPTT